MNVDLDTIDPLIQHVLDRSTIDGVDASVWLMADVVEPERRACLLNILAVLRAKPRTYTPWIQLVDSVIDVMSDRVYARVTPGFLPAIRVQAADPTLPVYTEGHPFDKVHHAILRCVDPTDTCSLVSYRSEGSPSLQIVFAVSLRTGIASYAEFDLDIGNPLQDVWSFGRHLVELWDGKRTSHLKMFKRLTRSDEIGQFLSYHV